MPAFTLDELNARLQSLSRELVLYHAGRNTAVQRVDIMEAMTATLEAIAALSHEPFDRRLAPAPRGNRGAPIYDAIRDATSSHEITLRLLPVTDMGLRSDLVTTWADDALVTPLHLEMLGEAGPAQWSFFTPDRAFPAETRAYLDGQILSILDDVAHPRLIEVLLDISLIAGLSDMPAPTGPIAPRLLAYATGAVPGAMPTHQRLAATALLTASWAPPDVFVAVARLAGAVDESEVELALERAGDSPALWRAVAQSPVLPRALPALSKIRGACQDSLVWEAMFRVMRDAPSPDVDVLVRLLKSAPAAQSGAAVSLLIARHPDRAVEALRRLSPSRLHAIPPEALAPLLQSPSESVREAVVLLLGAVGTGAPPKPARGRTPK